MKLRPYQLRALGEIEAAFSLVRRVLFVLPTAGGKTAVAVSAIMRAVERGERVLFLAHRLELIDQAFERLIAAGLPRRMLGVIMANDSRANPRAMVQVGSVQTVVRRDVFDAQFIVIDEAHHAVAKTYQKIVGAYPEADVLGLTATPYGADGKGLAPAFDIIVSGPKTSELISDGWLAKPKTLTVPTELLPDLKRVKKARGDYLPSELEAAVSKRAIVGEIPAHYRKHADGLPAVLYGAGVEHAKMCRDVLAEAGIKAEHLDASTPRDERLAIIARLRSGETHVVTNCGILTEGWDFPDLGCVILARPTLSRVLHKQMVGRVMRPGKHQPIVLDHAGNVHVHGWPEDDDNATLEGREGGGGGKDGPRAKHCPECDSAVPLLSRECTECGHEFWTGGPPDEIAAHLTEELARSQTHCAGYADMPCDVPVSSNGRLSASMAKRGWKPWRCRRCRAAARFAEYRTVRERFVSTPCPGFGDTLGTCDKHPPPSACRPSKIDRRGGNAWMCKSCTSAMMWARDGFKEKTSDAIRAAKSDPAAKAAFADVQRRSWSNQANREKRIDAIRRGIAHRRDPRTDKPNTGRFEPGHQRSADSISKQKATVARKRADASPERELVGGE